MQNGKTVTTGLVLRVTETKETDKILTVLTPDIGEDPPHCAGGAAEKQPHRRRLPAAGLLGADAVQAGELVYAG